MEAVGHFNSMKGRHKAGPRNPRQISTHAERSWILADEPNMLEDERIMVCLQEFI